MCLCGGWDDSVVATVPHANLFTGSQNSDIHATKFSLFGANLPHQNLNRQYFAVNNTHVSKSQYFAVNNTHVSKSLLKVFATLLLERQHALLLLVVCN